MSCAALVEVALAPDLPQCPRTPQWGCLPGPQNGRCCRETPPAPTGFSVIYRNPGHWDVVTAGGRAFRIRGEPGAVRVADERNFGASVSKDWLPFRSVAAAMTWCADQLMHEFKREVTF